MKSHLAASALFSGGVILGILISSALMLPKSPSKLRSSAGAAPVPRLAGTKLVTGQTESAEKVTALSEDGGESSTNDAEHFRRALESTLIGPKPPDPLSRFIMELNEHDAAKLNEHLDALRERLASHEAATATVASESPESIVVVVPPLFTGSDADFAFRDELARELGVELAEAFLKVARFYGGKRFADWGAAEQEFKIDLTRYPPFFECVRRGARLATYGEEYDPSSDRFAHLFRIEETQGSLKDPPKILLDNPFGVFEGEDGSK